MIDVQYLPVTNELEVVNDLGFPEYISMDSLDIVDANERELGTEFEYKTKDDLHVIFYPEGRLVDWWIEDTHR